MALDVKETCNLVLRMFIDVAKTVLTNHEEIVGALILLWWPGLYGMTRHFRPWQKALVRDD